MAAVCHFNDDTSSARRQLSYAVKQIIAKEVEMERMRRMEHVMIEKVSSQEVGGSPVLSSLVRLDFLGASVKI